MHACYSLDTYNNQIFILHDFRLIKCVLSPTRQQLLVILELGL